MNDDQCLDHALLGGRCELTVGHGGAHQKTYEGGYVARWDDASKARMVAYVNKFEAGGN